MKLTLSKGDNIRKSPALWAHVGSCMIPLVYFRKPKWMPPEQFAKLIDGMEIGMHMSEQDIAKLAKINAP